VNRTTSLYLDLVRFSAAVLVVLTHLAYTRFSGGMLTPLRTYGNDAVMIFFVLSGYVIAYTVAQRDRDFRTYAVNRFARLYSVAIPAIILTFILDHIGRQVDPVLYDGFWYQGNAPLSRMLAAITFTNELWFRSVRLFTNGPYWSLGYEFWYYMLFAAAVYARGKTRAFLLIGICALVGPKILLLLPVWLLGVWVHRVNSGPALSGRLGAVLFVLPIALYIAFRYSGMRDALLQWSYVQFGRSFVEGELMWSNEFLAAYCIGLMVACNFIGVHAVSGKLAPLLTPFEKPIRNWAGCTFSIYLFHYPLLQFFKAVLPLDAQSPASVATLLALTLIACRLLGSVTENRKDFARSLVARCADFLIDRVALSRRTPTGP
jgi:peptidoglycan/LPS O-acetylase OafA/YrhL